MAKKTHSRNGRVKRTSNLARQNGWTDEGFARAANPTGAGATADTYITYSRTEVPGGDTSNDSQKIDAFTKARLLPRQNEWLRNYLRLKRYILNFGLIIGFQEEDGKKKKPSKKDMGDPMAKWLAEPSAIETGTLEEIDKKTLGVPGQAIITNGERLMQFIRDAWVERILQDNVLAFWSKDQKFAITLAPEKCRYKDTLGVETLFFRHGLGTQDLKLLDEAQQERFSEAEIAIDGDKGEYFKVLKEESLGNGLAWPSVQSIFRTISTIDSMQMSEAAYAFAGRAKWRQHKIGHKIESGAKAGQPLWFWTQKKGNAIKNLISDKAGYLGDLPTNFDHDTLYPHEDEKFFDEKKWLSPEHRLVNWGGPLAAMMVAKGLTPFLTPLLKAECLEIRREMKSFLESVINQAFLPSQPIKISWSNLIFNDSKTMFEALKFAQSMGGLSHKTVREEIGFDDAREEARKEAEALEAEDNPGKFKPPFDSAHGDPDQGGKPEGGQDDDNKNAS